MKISRRRLRKLVKSEKTKRLFEQSTIAAEGALLADLSKISDSIQEIADGMYGLQDPGDPGLQVGDEMGSDLSLQVERLNSFFDKLQAYFETVDDLAGRNPGGSVG